ncbi:MAG: DUF4158 domain-containing protein [Clostridium sp.]
MRRRILSDEERDSIFNLDYSCEELAIDFIPNIDDLVKVGRINKDWNKIGYIAQKHILKSRGFTVNTFSWSIPSNILNHICNQVCVDGDVDIDKYSRTVRLEDLKLVMKELGYKKFKPTKEIKQQAFKIALTNRSEYEMVYELIYYLRREKIALPAVTTIEKVIWDAINESNNYIYTKIVEQIEGIGELEYFLEVQEGRFSPYQMVKNTKSRGIEDIQTKIKTIEKYNLDIDLSFIPNRKLQAIYEDVVSCSREKLLRFKNDKKRLAYIVIYVKQTLKILEDELIITDREQEKNKYKKIEVTEGNIVRVYNRFVNEVVLKQEEYKENTLVSLFLDIVIYKSVEGYAKNEKGYFLEQGEIVYIDKREYEKFINDVIVTKYTSTEKMNLIAVSDKLQDIANRRAEGSYYTKRVWVDEANKILEQELGTDWKDKYVVWDCASGVGNLTNGYIFKELYISSLNSEDLKYAEDGVKFQFDFLNDDIEKSHKIPFNIVRALEKDKPIIFYINPPYKASNEVIEVEGIRYSTPTTKVGKQMQREGLGVSSNQLYTQFLRQIINIKHRYNLSNVSVAIFSPTTYIEGERFSRFRDLFLSELDFKSGMIFDAREFNQVYGKWDVSFSIWGSGYCKNKSEFLHLQKEVGPDGKIVTKDIRVLRNKD